MGCLCVHSVYSRGKSRKSFKERLSSQGTWQGHQDGRLFEKSRRRRHKFENLQERGEFRKKHNLCGARGALGGMTGGSLKGARRGTSFMLPWLSGRPCAKRLPSALTFTPVLLGGHHGLPGKEHGWPGMEFWPPASWLCDCGLLTCPL